MLEWSPVISPATLLTGAMALVSLFAWVLMMGGRLNEMKTAITNATKNVERVEERLNVHKQNREHEREIDRKERDQFQIAVNAALEAHRGQLSEFREGVAMVYATKREMEELERRTNQGMDRIVDRLEQINSRLETIGDAIIKTLATR